MTKRPIPTVAELLEEVDRWAYWLSIGAIVIFTIAFFLISAWAPPNGFVSSIRAYMIAIIPNLVPVFVIFVFSYVFLRRIQSIRAKEESKELIEKISAQTQDDLRNAMRTFEQAKQQIVVFPSRTAVYSAGISSLNSGAWKRVRVFAPVGLWRRDDDKRLWLNELAEHVKARTVQEVWGVFGLPPKTEIEDGKVRMRDSKKVIEELKYVHELLGLFDGLTTVRLHYYPPAYASVGFGSIIFEKADGTGQVAFGLASHAHAEVVDAGLGLDDREINREFFSYALSWFDSRIFWNATSAYILQDDKKAFSERWAGLVKAWYPELTYVASTANQQAG